MRSAAIEAHAVVGDGEPQLRASVSHTHDHASVPADADGVADGVLNERLQDQGRDGQIQRARIGVDLDAELRKANALDRDVSLDEGELAPQRAPWTADARQRMAQQVTQITDHLRRAAWVGVDELHERVERVEQEVRLKL